MTVLALEPDPAQSEAIRHVVCDLVHAEVVFARSVDEAVRKLEEVSPDLVLLPPLMPAAGAAALTTALRVLPHGSAIVTLTTPVLEAPEESAPQRRGWFTRGTRPDDAAKAREAGARRFAERLAWSLSRAADRRREMVPRGPVAEVEPVEAAPAGAPARAETPSGSEVAAPPAPAAPVVSGAPAPVAPVDAVPDDGVTAAGPTADAECIEACDQVPGPEPEPPPATLLSATPSTTAVDPGRIADDDSGHSDEEPVATAVEADAPPAGDPAERRRHPRLAGPFEGRRFGPIDLPIQIRDISEGGCFVNSVIETKIGHRLTFELVVPGGTPLQLSGRVVTNVPPFGFGVRFSGLSDEARDALAHFVASRLGIAASAGKTAPPRGAADPATALA